jgi:SAM-dependent methyltransferase
MIGQSYRHYERNRDPVRERKVADARNREIQTQLAPLNTHLMITDLRLICPLCLVSGQTTEVHGADRRRYYLCGNCSLIFTDPEHDLSPAEAKAFYLTHENSSENSGYVNFLNRVVQPMLAHLDRGMRGLDYGCGPGPTVSLLVQRQGIACDDYDPLFADRPLRPPYDFIFSTECFEHFRRPEVELRRISSLLRPAGLLGVMTERWTTLEAFANWYYTRDPTHVCFYHAKTLDFVCRQFSFTPVWMDASRVAILRRNSSGSDTSTPSSEDHAVSVFHDRTKP